MVKVDLSGAEQLKAPEQVLILRAGWLSPVI